MVRYNLYVGKAFGKVASAFIGVVLPWIIAVFFYQGQGFTIFVNWSSIIIGTAINFVVPFWVYMRARRFHENRRFSRNNEEDEESDDDPSLSKGAIYSNQKHHSVENYDTVPDYDIWNMVDEEFKKAPGNFFFFIFLILIKKKKCINLVLRAMPRKWKKISKIYIPRFLWISMTMFALVTIGLMINQAVH